MIVWHYTIRKHALSILESGIIKTSDLYLLRGEKPILWFSSNQYWEHTADKDAIDAEGNRRHLDMEQTWSLAGGLFRFGVSEERLTKWPEIGKRANMSALLRRSLMKVAREKGANPAEWYGALQPVALNEIEAVQGLDPKTRHWVDVEE